MKVSSEVVRLRGCKRPQLKDTKSRMEVVKLEECMRPQPKETVGGQYGGSENRRLHEATSRQREMAQSPLQLWSHTELLNSISNPKLENTTSTQALILHPLSPKKQTKKKNLNY